MAITISGDTGVAGVDGSASTPALQGADTNTGVRFGTDTVAIVTGGADRVVTDSAGNVWIGTTAGNNPVGDRVNGFSILSTGSVACRSSVGWDWGVSGSSGTHVQFYTDNGSTFNAAGTISSNGATTSYNTSSDYRLKENVAPMQNALATVAQLKPCTYTWKSTGEAGQGFIAHELQAVVPDCVTGEKDAVDEEGNPQYQGVDTSFLVATLVAAIQEQQTLITDLTARLEALEAK